MALEDALKRALDREKNARREAESLLEAKSLQLWDKNKELEQANANLQLKIQEGRIEMERLSRFPLENPQPVLRTSFEGDLEFFNKSVETLLDSYSKEIDTFLKETASSLSAKETKQLDVSFGSNTYNVMVVRIEQHEYINFYFTDVTQLRRATNVIKFNEEKYRGVIENIELGLLELDQEMVVSRVYSKVLEINGMRADEVIGKSGFDLLLNPKSLTIEDFRNGTVETRAKHANNEDLWVRISTAPLQNIDGERIGFIAVIQDVSQSYRRYEQLKEAQLQAVESGKAKERFLANMSHELRTPMNAISGMAQLLNENVHSEKEQRFIQTIIKATNNLLVVLDDVLHLSKIEAGQLELEIRDTSLYDLLEHVKETMSMKALEKGLGFNLELEKSIHDFVKTDSVRLGQVLLNLVNNAIKFTSKGYVTVKVDPVETTESSQRLKFSVKDSGIGIKEDNLEKIFQAFSQADNSIERKFGGTGLGLAISKQIIESMGGEIEVQSIPDLGSSFSFELLFELGKGSLSQSAEEELDQSLLEGLDVILAEDNEFNGFLVQELLSGIDLSLRWAKNGKEVLTMVAERKPDLILMDIQMPEMGGEECTLNLRREYDSDSLRIIALTANVFRKDITKYFGLGMNGYLSKPFKKNDLFKSILTDSSKDEKKIEKQLEPFEFSYSLEVLESMVGGKNSVGYKKMLAVFVEHTPESIQALSDAAEAKHKEQIKACAHKLKSSFKLFKVEPASHFLSELEEKIEKLSHEEISKRVETVIANSEWLLQELS